MYLSVGLFVIASRTQDGYHLRNCQVCAKSWHKHDSHLLSILSAVCTDSLVVLNAFHSRISGGAYHCCHCLSRSFKVTLRHVRMRPSLYNWIVCMYCGKFRHEIFQSFPCFIITCHIHNIHCNFVISI